LEDHVIARAAASVVVATSLVLGASGCAFFAPVASQIKYEPADGTASTIGDIELRNVVALSEDGTTASLVFGVVNDSGSMRTVDFEYTDATGANVTQTLVAPEGLSSVGGGEDEPSVELSNLDVTVGGLLPVFVSYGTEEGKGLMVPILDGEQEQYSTLVPTDTAE
jgi:hypothetical protein